MKIASLPDDAKQIVEKGMTEYLSGAGGIRLNEKGINPARLVARGALAEARLSLANVSPFLDAAEATGPERAGGVRFERFFDRLSIFLFEGDNPIGTVGLVHSEGRGYVLEHVTLGGVQEVIAGLVAVEGLSGSDGLQVRLLNIPRIYLSALVLMRAGAVDKFFTLLPPYEQAGEGRTDDFRKLVNELIEHHRANFPAG